MKSRYQMNDTERIALIERQINVTGVDTVVMDLDDMHWLLGEYQRMQADLRSIYCDGSTFASLRLDAERWRQHEKALRHRHSDKEVAELIFWIDQAIAKERADEPSP